MLRSFGRVVYLHFVKQIGKTIYIFCISIPLHDIDMTQMAERLSQCISKLMLNATHNWQTIFRMADRSLPSRILLCTLQVLPKSTEISQQLSLVHFKDLLVHRLIQRNDAA